MSANAVGEGTAADLKNFLKHADDEIEIARRRKLDHDKNITVVGDEFMAVAVLGAQTGYRRQSSLTTRPDHRERIRPVLEIGRAVVRRICGPAS